MNGSLNSENNDLVTVPANQTMEAELLPRHRRRRVELRTLRGVSNESARRYREWSQGRISRSTYAVAVMGLSKHKDILTAIGSEEQLRAIELIRQQLDRIESGAPAADSHRGAEVTA